MCFPNRRSVKSPRYQRIGILQGHEECVNSLSLTKMGDLLASGGSDGIRLWNMKNQSQLTAPAYSLAQQGAVTCVRWITRPCDAEEMLFYGTALGYIGVWARQPSGFKALTSERILSGHEILSVANDTSTDYTATAGDKHYLVVSSRVGSILIVEVDKQGEIYPYWSKGGYKIPKTVAFSKEGDLVHVFGLWDGIIYTLKSINGKQVSTTGTGLAMANVAINHDRGLFAVDNVTQGFSLYSLKDMKFQRECTVGEPKRRYPKQVEFGEDGCILVGGSDHGTIYVFDRKTARVVETLHHDDNSLSQALTTHSAGGVHTIVSAETTPTKDSKIYVWKYVSPNRSGDSKLKDGEWYQLLEKAVQLATQLAIIIGVLLFLGRYFGIMPRSFGLKDVATQWADSYIQQDTQPDAQHGPYESSDHDVATSEQTNKIKSLERLVRILMSSKSVELEARLEKPAEGLVMKDIVSWSD